MSNQHRILIVDDEEGNRVLLADVAKDLGYEVETAADGFEALAKLKFDIDLVLLDAAMPGMDGFEVARRIRADATSGDIPIAMVTGLTSKKDRLRAVEAGANDFISKPVDQTEISVRTASLLKMKQAQDGLKRHQAELEKTVEKRTADLRRALQEMADAQRKAHQAHLDTIERLAVASEYKDEDTAAHIHRIGEYCGILGRRLNLSPSEVETLTHAAPMHDVGKIGIPDAILLKPGKLDESEWETMRQHTTIGARILAGSSSELLRAGEVIAQSHHEKWDGSGYPKGLAGEEIPLWGRICAVADVFDALATDRPYRKAMPNEEVLRIVKEGRGKHFDPRLPDVFLADLDEAFAIQSRHACG